MTPTGTPDEGVTFDLGDQAVLADPGWLSVRRTPAEVAVIRDGRLVITGDGRGLDDVRPSFLGRRLRHMSATISRMATVCDPVRV